MIFIEDNAITWLKYNREPWEEVQRLWNDTLNLRKSSKCHTLSEFIQEWPIIEDPRAQTLVQLNFTLLVAKNFEHYWQFFTRTDKY